jgi:hypothetical protein
MTKLLKLFIPPIFMKITKYIIQIVHKNKIVLFEGYESKSFQEHVSKAKVYGEYGMGQSTKWVYKHTNAEIISVESNDIWLKLVSKEILDKNRCKFIWADIGDIYDGYGRPTSYEKRDNFFLYFNGLWTQENKPEVVLIDGRFRVACFLTSLINANADTIIIFDDYTYRPYYHIVEEIIEPFEINGRQGLFKVPANFDLEKTQRLLNDFKYVVD